MILRRANGIILKYTSEANIWHSGSEFLPSATFAVAKIDKQKVEILQGGDTLAVWQMKDGTIGGIPNLIFDYEERQTSMIAKLMEKHQGNRQKMWEEFRPFLAEDRRKNINASKGFAIINGQPWFVDFLQEFKFSRNEIKRLILFSDGLIPFEFTRNATAMASAIIALYKNGGLSYILEETRRIAKKEKDLSHEDYPEATAIAIEF